MDENNSHADESEEDCKTGMEKNIDEFLSNIRETVSKNTDPECEAACSEIRNELDSISSDDCFGRDESSKSLHSRSDKSGVMIHVRKLSAKQSTCKNRHGMEESSLKDEGMHKQSSSSHDERYSNSDKRLRQRKLSTSEDEYHQHKKQFLSKRDEHHDQKSHPPKGKDEHHHCKSASPRMRDEFHEEKSVSPRSEYHQGQNLSPRGRDECHDGRSLSPYEGDNSCQGRKFFARGRHEYKKRNLSLEEMDCAQDGYYSDEGNLGHKMSSSSRSSDNESWSHRMKGRGSDSPSYWSESQDYDCDYDDQNSNPHWRHGDPFREEDCQNSSIGTSSSSILSACLERVIAVNPEMAKKLTEACMSLLNKSVDGLSESDYEYEEDLCATFEEESGRVFPQSWSSNRSPSFTDSLGGPSRHLGFSHKDRFQGHSRRIVLERSLSPEAGHFSDDRQARGGIYNYPDRLNEARYSPRHQRHDKKRPSATSDAFSARKRSFSNYQKNYLEEEFDPKATVIQSIRKIRKQCEGESNSTVRHALLSLLEVHERECKRYLRKPEAHPDHNKEYRVFLEQKTKSIIDLGGDPDGFDFQQEWKKYWPVQMNKLFKGSWDAKMHKCTSLLQKKKGFSHSKSSHSSSRKVTTAQPPEMKQKTHKHGSAGERENLEKSPKNLEATCSDSQEQQGCGVSSTASCKKQEDMNIEIFNILKLLSHIKHRFKDCESSFDTLYKKALSLKQDSSDINDILQSNLPLLEKIDENLKETLQDESLSLIQKAIIQETHERFKGFLKKSKEDSHSIKNKGGENVDKKHDEEAVEEHQIPCHLTSSHPSAFTSQCSKQGTMTHYSSCSCCDSHLQKSQPRRTLMEVSLVGSSCTESDALKKLEDEKQCNREFTFKSNAVNIDKEVSRPRILTEVSLVGSSCPDSNASHECNAVSVEKDSDMAQPPPPGVTPPPSGITPPQPSITPPPLSVIPPLASATPPLTSATPPPPGVTPPSHGETSQPPLTHCIAPTSPSSTVSCHSATPSLHSITAPPVITPPLLSVIPQPVVLPVTLSITPTSAIAPTPLSVTPPPPGVTPPPPGVTPPVSDAPESSVLTLSKAPFLVSQSATSQSLIFIKTQLCSDETLKATQLSSTVSTTLVQSKQSLKNKVTKTPKQPSKELLRTTIKDCFLSLSPSEERDVDISTKEESVTIGSITEEGHIYSMSGLPEDILKMFEVKPKDTFNSDHNAHAKLNSSGNCVESNAKPATKKPIKITIPQFSKRNSMPEFNPITDDQELL